MGSRRAPEAASFLEISTQPCGKREGWARMYREPAAAGPGSAARPAQGPALVAPMKATTHTRSSQPRRLSAQTHRDSKMQAATGCNQLTRTLWQHPWRTLLGQSPRGAPDLRPPAQSADSGTVPSHGIPSGNLPARAAKVNPRGGHPHGREQSSAWPGSLHCLWRGVEARSDQKDT